MRTSVYAAVARAFVLVVLTALPAAAQPPVYPDAPTNTASEEHFGIRTTDRYRPLEDMSSADTRRWVAQEQALTAQRLAVLPLRERIRADVLGLFAREEAGVPRRYGSRYFFEARLRGDGEKRLYTSAGPSDTPAAVFDGPARRAPAAYAVSDGGRYVAYTNEAEGDASRRWRVWDVGAGRDLPDVSDDAPLSNATWDGDRGFYYAKAHRGIVFHVLGRAPALDVCVYEDENRSDLSYDTAVSDDGRYLIVSAARGTEPVRLVVAKELGDPSRPAVRIAGGGDASYTVIGSRRHTVWLVTDDHAPKRRIVSVDLDKPADVHEAVSESSDVIRSAALAGDSLVVTYLRDAHTVLRRFGAGAPDGRDVPLPGVGTVTDVTGVLGTADLYYAFSAFGSPPSVFRYDARSNRSGLVASRAQTAPSPSFVTEQVFVTAADGVRVPMFVSHRAGVAPSPDTPVLLMSYGGFGVSMTPSYSESYAEWMRLGGTVAIANVRGGGEYGPAWHAAGAGRNKSTTFSDFVACAEWLVRNRYTSPAKLAAVGISNGALTAANAIVLHPRLFGAGVLIDGVFDMLRYDRYPPGAAWRAEYGSPENETDYKSLLAYSPLAHVQTGLSYPATLIMASANDRRVFAAHSYKLAAAMQNAQGGTAPILIAVRADGQHGPSSVQSAFADQVADGYAFLLDALGVTVPETAP